MNYAATYCALISNRLRNQISKKDCYCETHHIIPKSEGGDDSKDNLVNLTAREHYVAHLLLWKIYKDYKMSVAVQMMSLNNGLQSERRKTMNSRLFAKIREYAIAHRKERVVPRGWKQDPEWIAKRTAHKIGVPRSEESKEKQRQKMKGRKQSMSQIRNAAQTRMGRKWWNNGIEAKFQKERPSGEGWIEGRLKSHTKGLYQFNTERQQRI